MWLQMSSTGTSYFGLALVGSVTLGFSLALIFLVTVTPREVTNFVAAVLAIIGAFNSLLYRRLGSQVYRWGEESSSGFISSFWLRLGESAAQRFYLFVGILLLITAAALLLKGQNVF